MGGEPTDALIASDFLKLGRLSWFKCRADDFFGRGDGHGGRQAT